MRKSICKIFIFGAVVAGLLTPLTVLGAAQTGDLWTSDGACQFHYTTEKNTNGWTFKIDKGACVQGLVQGAMTLTIFDAFARPIEQIYGLFNRGYWTGEREIDRDILTDSADGTTRKLTFLLGEDSKTKTQFIGQMSAEQKADKTYGPFLICNPAKILIIDETGKAFDNAAAREALASRAKKYAADICPDEKNIMLFGAAKIDPVADDILFYADVDVEKDALNILKTPMEKIAPASSIPEPDTSVSANPKQIEIPRTPDIPAHLVLLSRVLQKPAGGRIVVEIRTVEADNTAFVAASNIRLKGVELRPGWFVAIGQMDARARTGEDGTFVVDSLTACKTAECPDEWEGENAS